MVVFAPLNTIVSLLPPPSIATSIKYTSLATGVTSTAPVPELYEVFISVADNALTVCNLLSLYTLPAVTAIVVKLLAVEKVILKSVAVLTA